MCALSFCAAQDILRPMTNAAKFKLAIGMAGQLIAGVGGLAFAALVCMAIMRLGFHGGALLASIAACVGGAALATIGGLPIPHRKER